MDKSKNDRFKGIINNYFSETTKKVDDPHKSFAERFSFSNALKKNVNTIVQQCFGILVHYFNKYSEPDFHNRMANRYTIIDGYTKQPVTLTGFDFVGDFKKFHKKKFLMFVYLFNKSKNMFDFDEAKIMKSILDLFQAKGWHLSQVELQGIQSTTRRLYNILYNEVDSVQNIPKRY